MKLKLELHLPNGVPVNVDLEVKPQDEKKLREASRWMELNPVNGKVKLTLAEVTIRFSVAQTE